MNLESYKINFMNDGDDSLIIIGIKKSILDLDSINIYGYDCYLQRIIERKKELEENFPEYFFVIRKFYSVL